LTSRWFQAFAFCGGTLFAGSGEEGIFVSTNNGTSWSESNNGIECFNITALASDGINVYAGTADSGIYLSTDNGNNWSPVNEGLSSTRISSLLIINGYLFTGTKPDGVYVSDDNGVNWAPASNGLPAGITIRCLSGFEGNVLAGTDDGGIYVTEDYGNNWLFTGNGLPGSPVLALCVDDEYLFAGINGDGVWKRQLEEITGIRKSNENINLAIFQDQESRYLLIESAPGTRADIFSLSGQFTGTLNIVNNPGRIDISAWKRGVYMVRTSTGKQRAAVKFIKQ
jgi:photosystem II stability/assembly factor-like uncharacterized protein